MIRDWFLRYRDRVAVWYWPVLLVQLVWLRARLIAEVSLHGPDTILYFDISPTGRVTLHKVAAPLAEPSKPCAHLAAALAPEPRPQPPRPVRTQTAAWPVPERAVPFLDSS